MIEAETSPKYCIDILSTIQHLKKNPSFGSLKIWHQSGTRLNHCFDAQKTEFPYLYRLLVRCINLLEEIYLQPAFTQLVIYSEHFLSFASQNEKDKLICII